MAKITETTIAVEDLEIGGNAVKRIFPEDVKETLKFTVKSYTVEPTEWGPRVDFTLVDEMDEWSISSWNFVSKKKYKPIDLIGKDIFLKPHSEKKLLMEL